MRLSFVVTLCITAAACSGSASSPTAPDAARVFEGQAVSAIDGTAMGAVNIRIGNGSAVQTDANGNFHVDVGSPGTYAAVVTGAPVVERRTSVTGPTAERTKMTLIPATFDLDAFNEMFRATSNRLQRWTERPSLVVLGSVMKYVNGARDEYEATAEQLSDAETAAFIAHLTEGLALLTGGTYTSFASVVIERPPPGQQVNVQRARTIVAGRYVGIYTSRNTIGYGAWADQPDGTVVGGSMWLDRDFDRDNAQRRLLRIHELGHALGYTHVTARTSVMNPVLGPEPTDFDRAGALIAFQRPVGNTSPDSDPGGTARAFRATDGTARWNAPVPCLDAPVEADNPQRAFVKAWTGQPVVLKRMLYSLIYNERGKLGTTRNGQREGVLVTTPLRGEYFQFDGRQGRDDVFAMNPELLVKAVFTEYEPDALDVRPYRKLDPLAVHRFEPGVALVVNDVRIERDEVTLAFAEPGGGKNPVTSLRIKWPLPLSPTLSERPALEDVVRRFVEAK